MCGADMLEEQKIDAVVDDLMRFEVAASEALRETCGPRGADAVTAIIRVHEATRETLRAALVYNDYEAVSTPLDRTLSRLGLVVEPGGESWMRAARRAARGLLEVADENIRREQGIYRADDRLLALDTTASRAAEAHLPTRSEISLPTPPALQPVASVDTATQTAAPAASMVKQVEPRPQPIARSNARKIIQTVQIPKTPTGHESDDQPLTADSPFSAWFDAAIDRKREDNPGWDTNNLSNWRATRKLFLEAHGDRPMSFFGKAELREFRSLLCALPKNHHKSSDAPGLYQIIDEAEAEESRELILAENEIQRNNLNRGDAEQRRARARITRIKVNTVYRHMQAIQFIFRNAADHGGAMSNAMKGVIWTTKQLEKLQAEEKDTRRLPWGDKLVDLFGTTAFTAPIVLGTTPHAVFWPTLIAAHAGLRQEEALQLRTDDVDTMNGIPILRIQSGDGQHIKSGTRYRIIPIHKNLIELGFLIHVEECRRNGQDWLFPDIRRCAAKGRLSGTFTKTFGHYRIAEGVYDPRRDFHSLRTHFNVELKRADCPLEIRKRLLGHKLRDITEEHYDPEGSPIEKFKEWVDGIEIDISNVWSPYTTAEPTSRGPNVVALGARR